MSTPTCHLTRALIGPRTVYARGLHDAYAWHQLVWKAFPGRDGEARDFLTRLDDKPGGMQLLIVSPAEPTRPDWLSEYDEWESKAIPSGFFQARCYRFQLHANPTVKRVVRDAAGVRKKGGKREAIKGEAELRAWLQRKGEAGGFRLPESAPPEVFSDVRHFAKKPKSGQAMNGTHGAVEFSGILEVTDPMLFLTHTFTKGIGSAKAFGFGLLVLAPV